MAGEKTHRKIETPAMAARYLADWMASSEQRKRTLEKDCKYQTRARLPQHKEAKTAIVGFFRGTLTHQQLVDKAKELRRRSASDDFEREMFNNNADYIDRFATVHHKIQIPRRAEIVVAGPPVGATFNGLRVTIDGAFRLTRSMGERRSCGIATLRYQKGRGLSDEVANWQSALMWGMLDEIDDAENISDRKLTLTIDAYSGFAHPAPGDAKNRFKNMKAACTSIAQRWNSIEPPSGAVV